MSYRRILYYSVSVQYYSDPELPDVLLSLERQRGQVKLGVDKNFCYQNEVISAQESDKL